MGQRCVVQQAAADVFGPGLLSGDEEDLGGLPLGVMDGMIDDDFLKKAVDRMIEHGGSSLKAGRIDVNPWIQPAYRRRYEKFVRFANRCAEKFRAEVPGVTLENILPDIDGPFTLIFSSTEHENISIIAENPPILSTDPRKCMHEKKVLLFITPSQLSPDGNMPMTWIVSPDEIDGFLLVAVIHLTFEEPIDRRSAEVSPSKRSWALIKRRPGFVPSREEKLGGGGGGGGRPVCVEKAAWWRRAWAFFGKGKTQDGEPWWVPGLTVASPHYTGSVGKNWAKELCLTPYDQHSCGCCWVMCSVKLLESMMVIARRKESLSVQYVIDFCEPGADFSLWDRIKIRFWKYLGCNVACGGGSPWACTKFLAATGTPRARNWSEYVARDRWPAEIRRDKKLFGSPELFRIRHPCNIGLGLEEPVDELFRMRICVMLVDRPVITSVTCLDWDRGSLDARQIYRGRYGPDLCHCLLLVSYDEKKRLWGAFNSHGEKYGDNGVFYIPWDAPSGIGQILITGVFD